MKIVACIKPIIRVDCPESLFDDLCRIYPEGNRLTLFELELPLEDPRVNAVVQTLSNYGFERQMNFKPASYTQYRYQLLRTYEDSDIATAKWIALYPRGGWGFSSSFERLKSGLLKVTPSVVRKGIDIAFPNRRWIVISDALKQLVERESFEHVVVLPTQPGSGKATGKPPVWELTSDLLLPPVAPSIAFCDVSGNPWNERSVGHCLLFQEPYASYQLAYSRLVVDGVESFDVAATTEHILGRDRGDLIVSQRFYRFMRDLKLDIEWVPIRIDDDFDMTVSSVPTARRIEITIPLQVAPVSTAQAPTLAEGLDRLRDFQVRFPQCFGEPATESEIDGVAAKTMLPTPQAWKEVWKVASGFDYGQCSVGGSVDSLGIFSAQEVAGSETVPLGDYDKDMIANQFTAIRPEKGGNGNRSEQPKKLPGGEHASLMRSLRYASPDFPLHYLLVGVSYSGDMIGLDTSVIDQSGGCPVVLIDHEVNDISHEWPSVAEFLVDVLVEPTEDEYDE